MSQSLCHESTPIRLPSPLQTHHSPAVTTESLCVTCCMTMTSCCCNLLYKVLFDSLFRTLPLCFSVFHRVQTCSIVFHRVPSCSNVFHRVPSSERVSPGPVSPKFLLLGRFRSRAPTRSPARTCPPPPSWPGLESAGRRSAPLGSPGQNDPPSGGQRAMAWIRG